MAVYILLVLGQQTVNLIIGGRVANFGPSSTVTSILLAALETCSLDQRLTDPHK